MENDQNKEFIYDMDKFLHGFELYFLHEYEEGGVGTFGYDKVKEMLNNSKLVGQHVLADFKSDQLRRYKDIEVSLNQMHELLLERSCLTSESSQIDILIKRCTKLKSALKKLRELVTGYA